MLSRKQYFIKSVFGEKKKQFKQAQMVDKSIRLLMLSSFNKSLSGGGGGGVGLPKIFLENYRSYNNEKSTKWERL